MATNYPSSLDNFTNPTSASPINSPSHADQHANANDAIEAIEGELGTNPKGAKSTVKARLDDVDTAIATKAPIDSPTFTGTVTIPTDSLITGVPYLASANTFTVGPQTINTGISSNPGLVIKGASGQNSGAALTQWQSSASALLAQVTGTGRIYSSVSLTAGAISTTLGTFTSVATSSTVIGAVIRGAVSQTANLQEWQNSSGVNLVKIGADGSTTFASPIVGFVGTSGSYLSTPVSAYNIIHLSQGMIFINSQTGGDYNLATNTYYNSGWKYFESGGSTLINFGSGRFDFSTAPSGTAGNAITYTSKMMIANSGTVTVNGFGASSIGLIVKGAASQTANLQEWQNSAGTVLSRIREDGTGFFPIVEITRIFAGGIPGDWTNYSLYSYSTAANRITLGLQGNASQTADLTQWQNSAGTVLAKVDSAGTVIIGASRVQLNGNNTASYFADGISSDGNYSGGGTVRGTTGGIFGGTTQLSSAGLTVYATAAGNPGAIIRGAASQTANLQEWQASDGTVYGRFNAYGSLYVSNNTEGGTAQFGNTGFASASSVVLKVKGSASQTANLQEWQNSSGSNVAYMSPAGRLALDHISASVAFTNYVVNPSDNGPYFYLTSTNASLTNRNTASNIVFTVKGMASQTGDLQQWQNSSGTVLAKIYSGGAAQFQTTQATKLDVGDYPNSIAGNYINVKGASASTIGIIVRAATSQTADLTQWQNSAGTVLAKVQSGGEIQSLGFNSMYNSYFYSGDATATPIRVIGAASQTGDLQRWQNSAGTVLTKVTSSGSTFINSIGVSNDPLTVQSNSSTRFRIDPYSNTLALLLTVGAVDTVIAGTTAGIYALNASTVGLIIKGAASQTANLQEWQNSAGYAGTAIDSSGSFYAPGIYSSYLMQATAGGAAVVPLTVKGVISQTANLTEWKDSAGNAQAYVRYDGFINTNSSIRIAGDNLSVYRFQGVSDGNYTMNFPGSGNIQLFSATDSLGGGSKVLGISNATTVPSSNPTGGGILYVSSGSLVYRGASGAITTIARSGNESSTISVNTATTVDTVALSSFTTIEYTISIKQGSKVRSSKVLVHTDGTSIDSTEYGIMEMGGGITGILVTASVSSTNSILQVTITDASTTNATVKIIKTML